MEALRVGLRIQELLDERAKSNHNKLAATKIFAARKEDTEKIADALNVA